MKKLFLAALVLLVSAGAMQANKVATTGYETPEQMDYLVKKHGVQNQPARSGAKASQPVTRYKTKAISGMTGMRL